MTTEHLLTTNNDGWIYRASCACGDFNISTKSTVAKELALRAFWERCGNKQDLYRMLLPGESWLEVYVCAASADIARGTVKAKYNTAFHSLWKIGEPKENELAHLRWIDDKPFIVSGAFCASAM